jgi:uncharacterized membrane protein
MTDSPGEKPRLDAIDLVRGAVMILMLLDHTRDFVHEGAMFNDPLDPATTTPILYATRWITHLCAPTFVLLAGLGAGLRSLRGVPVAAQSRALWTRGLWLVVIEFAVIRPLVFFNLDFRFLVQLQVIWAIGAAMIVLAVLVWLPVRVIAAIGLAIVLGHNALDGLRVAQWGGPETPVPGALEKLWMLVHQGGFFPIAGWPSPIVWAHYPLLPWIGILALGYVLAEAYRWPRERRRRLLFGLSAVMLAAFALLRATNLYGDPRPFVPQATAVQSVMAFLRVEKYPPSLLFTLVTLAPCLFALAVFDGRSFARGGPAAIVTFGRVPLFFYLLQWPTAHLAGIAVTLARGLDASPLFMNLLDWFQLRSPPVTGGPLWVVYPVWIAGVLLLYWPCRWFARVKARRRDWWLSYL